MTESGGTTFIWWVGPRDGVKHPTMHKAADATEDYPAQNINSANFEKACSSLFHDRIS